MHRNGAQGCNVHPTCRSTRGVYYVIYMDEVYVPRGHDYMDVGGRATPGAVAEESEGTRIRYCV